VNKVKKNYSAPKQLTRSICIPSDAEEGQRDASSGFITRHCLLKQLQHRQKMTKLLSNVGQFSSFLLVQLPELNSANSIACLKPSVCLCVCLCVNQGATNHNSCTRDL